MNKQQETLFNKMLPFIEFILYILVFPIALGLTGALSEMTMRLSYGFFELPILIKITLSIVGAFFIKTIVNGDLKKIFHEPNV